MYSYASLLYANAAIHPEKHNPVDFARIERSLPRPPAVSRALTKSDLSVFLLKASSCQPSVRSTCTYIVPANAFHNKYKVRYFLTCVAAIRMLMELMPVLCMLHTGPFRSLGTWVGAWANTRTHVYGAGQGLLRRPLTSQCQRWVAVDGGSRLCKADGQGPEERKYNGTGYSSSKALENCSRRT